MNRANKPLLYDINTKVILKQTYGEYVIDYVFDKLIPPCATLYAPVAPRARFQD